MNTYKKLKEKIRKKAIIWQLEFSQKDNFWSEISCYSNYFYKLGKRYGLLKEFRKNGII